MGLRCEADVVMASVYFSGDIVIELSCCDLELFRAIQPLSGEKCVRGGAEEAYLLGGRPLRRFHIVGSWEDARLDACHESLAPRRACRIRQRDIELGWLTLALCYLIVDLTSIWCQCCNNIRRETRS